MPRHPLPPRRRTAGVAAALALGLLTAACAGDYETVGTTAPGGPTEPSTPPTTGASGADAVLRLGVVLPQTGTMADLGPIALAGAQLAIDDLNAAGGVLGNDVELRSADSASTAPLAADAAEALLDDGVDALLVDARGEDLAGLLPVAEQAGVPVCASGPAGAALEATADIGILHRTTASPALEAGVALADLGDEVETVVVVHGDDDDATAMAAAVDDATDRTVVPVVLPADADDVARTAALASLVAASPDAVLLAVRPEVGAALLVDMTISARGPDELPVVALGSMATGALPALLAEAAQAAQPATTTTAPATTAATTTTAPARDLVATISAGLRGVQLAPRAPTEAFVARLGVSGTSAQLAAAAELYDCAVALAVAAASADADDPVELAVGLAAATSGGTPCADPAACLPAAAAGEDVDLVGVEGIELDPRGATTTGVVRHWLLRDGELAFIDAVAAPVEAG